MKHNRIKIGVTLFLTVSLFCTYLIWLQQYPWVQVYAGEYKISLPVASLQPPRTLDTQSEFPTTTEPHQTIDVLLENAKKDLIGERREDAIEKVTRFFAEYGADLQGYEELIVDRSEECGADYRIIVGIAGSESGLGRINYKVYNPFGYLNGVQYSSQEEALNVLICKIAEQHLVPCNNDIDCFAPRYAGPQDDLSLFKGKVSWFASQVS